MISVSRAAPGGELREFNFTNIIKSALNSTNYLPFVVKFVILADNFELLDAYF
jgi:hypothetical protein